MLPLMFQQNPIEMSWSQVSQAYTRFFVRMIDYLPSIIGALFVIGFTALIARLIRRTVDSAMMRTKAEESERFLVVRIGGILVWFVGLAVMLSVLSVNMGGAFAALGVTGAAIGFAVHDIVGNFVAGVVLLSIRPFKLGDVITIDTYEGAVERVEIRVTVLKTGDGKEVSIPNAKVFSAVIINHAPQKLRRLSFGIGIDYETPFEEAKEIILQAVRAVEGVAESPAPEVVITSFSANIVNIEIHCWIEQEASFGGATSLVKLAVMEALHQAHISVPPAASMVLLRPGRNIAGTAERA